MAEERMWRAALARVGGCERRRCSAGLLGWWHWPVATALYHRSTNLTFAEALLPVRKLQRAHHLFNGMTPWLPSVHGMNWAIGCLPHNTSASAEVHRKCCLELWKRHYCVYFSWCCVRTPKVALVFIISDVWRQVATVLEGSWCNCRHWCMCRCIIWMQAALLWGSSPQTEHKVDALTYFRFHLQFILGSTFFWYTLCVYIFLLRLFDLGLFWHISMISSNW